MYKQTPGFHQLKGQECYQTASEACNRGSAVAHLPQVPTSAFLKNIWFVIFFFHYCKSFMKVLLHLVQPESAPRPMVTHLWIQRQEFFTSVQGEVPFGISDKQIRWRQHSWISVQVMSMYVNLTFSWHSLPGHVLALPAGTVWVKSRAKREGGGIK